MLPVMPVMSCILGPKLAGSALLIFLRCSAVLLHCLPQLDPYVMLLSVVCLLFLSVAAPPKGSSKKGKRKAKEEKAEVLISPSFFSFSCFDLNT